ncbi:MAG: ligase 1, partial [Abditibacteriota bacterium]|nr:ligase 1 [Abditibacteriota bacterium]
MSTPSLSHTLFIEFARTAEAIGATTKRLEKAATLQKYFKGLGDEDLVLAARYFGGMLFPLRDSRVANVGGAALLAAIVSVTGEEENRFRERLVALGDFGDAAFEAWHSSPLALHEAVLSLRELNS